MLSNSSSSQALSSSERIFIGKSESTEAKDPPKVEARREELLEKGFDVKSIGICGMYLAGFGTSASGMDLELLVGTTMVEVALRAAGTVMLVTAAGTVMLEEVLVAVAGIVMLATVAGTVILATVDGSVMLATAAGTVMLVAAAGTVMLEEVLVAEAGTVMLATAPGKVMLATVPLASVG